MKTVLPILFLLLLGACSARQPAPVALPSASPVATSPTSAPAAGAPSRAPSATFAPSATPEPPTATPAPQARLVQLTNDHCCSQPFWSPDSREVLFIDKPAADAPTGIYGVSVDSPGPSKLVMPRIANYTSDLQYALSFEGTLTVVEHVSSGQQWRIQTGVRSVMLSPDRTRVVWNVTPETYPFENRVTTVMLAALAATPPAGSIAGQKLTTALRGGATAWLDNSHLLMNGRMNAGSEAVTFFVYNLEDGSTRPLVTAERLRGAVPSTGGKWIAYSIAFDKTASNNGTWLVPTDGSAPPRKLGWFGAFVWRDKTHLLYIPLDPGAASMAVYEQDVNSNVVTPLTDPATTPFKIANGDWSLSPDGNKIAFVGAQDFNLWVLMLP